MLALKVKLQNAVKWLKRKRNRRAVIAVAVFLAGQSCRLWPETCQQLDAAGLDELLKLLSQLRP